MRVKNCLACGVYLDWGVGSLPLLPLGVVCKGGDGGGPCLVLLNICFPSPPVTDGDSNIWFNTT